jgi:hypothetical protein
MYFQSGLIKLKKKDENMKEEALQFFLFLFQKEQCDEYK